jgi:hypothetical protein
VNALALSNEALGFCPAQDAVIVDSFFLDSIASQLEDGPAPYKQAFAILKTSIPERVAA